MCSATSKPWPFSIRPAGSSGCFWPPSCLSDRRGPRYSGPGGSLGSFSDCNPSIFLLIWFNNFQTLELKSENSRSLLRNVCLEFSTVQRVPLWDTSLSSTPKGVQLCWEPPTKRKESQVFPNRPPCLYQQPYPKKHWKAYSQALLWLSGQGMNSFLSQ